MNWITNFVRPKLQAIVGKKEVPDNLWKLVQNALKCCLRKELVSNQYVCKHCDYHFRISSKERLELFLEKFHDNGYT